MYIYEVGKKFPHENQQPGNEAPRLMTNSAFLDVILYSLDARNDAKFWGKGDMRNYLYVHEGAIPFVCVLFPQAGAFSFDAPLNALKIDEQVTADWLSGSGNLMNLFLVDARTNVLHSQRLISVTWAARLRAACKVQLKNYVGWLDVDGAISSASARVSTADMIRLSRQQS